MTDSEERKGEVILILFIPHQSLSSHKDFWPSPEFQRRSKPFVNRKDSLEREGNVQRLADYW